MIQVFLYSFVLHFVTSKDPAVKVWLPGSFLWKAIGALYQGVR